ncbi:MAG: alpha/beta hydrolase fold-domain-containing protein [Podila humilis]|nr:MAG: alpha/beta hydrolase fold-domain-containing protein [Podila humilis]
MPPQLKDHKGSSHSSSSTSSMGRRTKKNSKHPNHRSTYVYKRPSLLNRIYLAGLIHRPNDIYFLFHALVSIIWTVFQLLLIEMPLLIRTQFKTNSIHHPVSWGPFYSFCMARNYSIKSNVMFKVHLETLLQPERATLLKTRKALGLNTNGRRHQHRNPSDPSPEFFASFLPETETKAGRLANLPEESGPLDEDGTFTVRGEWIEAREEDGRKRSNVVLLYLHGGGHVFCSATFHRQMVTRLTLEFGPGARAFVVDYRLSPEDPFPAAVHDVYASYLYLTQPDHGAISPVHKRNQWDHPLEPVDPRDIVLAGDSAGGGLAIAFMLYMRDYVQPGFGTELILPSTTILLSVRYTLHRITKILRGRY